MNTVVGDRGGGADALHRAAFAADGDLLARRETGNAAHIDDGGPRRRRRREPGTGKAQQIVRPGRELRAGRDRRQRHGREEGLGVDQLPAGNVHRTGGGIVELDELVGGIAARGEANLVDLDRRGAAHPLPAGIGAAVPRCPHGEEAHARARRRGDLEGGAHAAPGATDGEGGRRRSLRGPASRHGDAQLTPVMGAPLVLVKLAVTSLAALGVKLVRRVCSRRATSYFAATILACTASVAASPGWPVVITPS